MISIKYIYLSFFPQITLKPLYFFFCFFLLFSFDQAIAGRGGGGPPTDVGGGPPTDVGGGPPTDVGGGPPTDVGGGPPTDVGGGPPTDVGGGPPTDVGGGPPTDVGGGPPSNINNQQINNQLNDGNNALNDSKSPFIIKTNRDSNFDFIDAQQINLKDIKFGIVNNNLINKEFLINASMYANKIRIESNSVVIKQKNFFELFDFDENANFYDVLIEDRSGYEHYFTVFHSEQEDQFILQPNSLKTLQYTKNNLDDTLKGFFIHRALLKNDLQGMRNIKSIYMMDSLPLLENIYLEPLKIEQK